MSIFSFFKGSGHDLDELARRLRIDGKLLKQVKPAYRAFSIPKRSGGERRILAPDPTLRELQRLILRRVLGRLRAHPAAHGFEKQRSIVTNALPHVGRDIVVRMDIRDFFESTTARRVQRYFREIGWNRESAAVLTRICTHQDHLPQGAPTSPRLANLVNFPLDAALASAAAKSGIAYTRYADDLTFSAPAAQAEALRRLMGFAHGVAGELGYKVHGRKKTHVRRRHHRQTVTGLVVNDGRPRLPRETRRRMRAIEHRLSTSGSASLSPDQIAGWRSLQSMIDVQSRL
jgi:RNA-directed DNA polymerase